MPQETPPVPTDTTAPTDAYRYAAFISYRHVEPDRRWAKWLHTALETYRVPARLVREQGVPSRVGRVFRDEEELPASDDLNAEIESALSQSRHLVVVCSPRTPQSLWVNREVERFREMGRGDRILALLIEGEPADAFPPALREVRHTEVDRAGAAYERVEQVEPLAADVRDLRHESPRYLRRMARLRVLASVLGVRFDDLRQREQERRARRLSYLGAALAILACVVGGLAVYAFRQRNEAVGQRQIADAQRQVADAQRVRAEIELAQGTVLQGDLLGGAGRWVEARDKYAAAASMLRRTGSPPVTAELGLWDADRHVSPPLHTLPGHAGGAWSIAVSPDGRQALSGGADGAVKLWDLPGARLLRSLPGHAGIVHAVAFLPGGRRALSAGDDKTVRLWDLASGAQLHAFPGHAARVRALACSADGSRLLSGDDANAIKLWDLDARAEIRTLDARGAVTCLAISADKSRAVAGTADAKLRLFDLTDGRPVRTLPGYAGIAQAVAFLPDGKTVFSVGSDNNFHFSDLAGQAPPRTFPNPSGSVGGAAISADGARVLAGTSEGPVMLFDAADGKPRRALVGGRPPAQARQVALAPDGRTAVSASADGAVDVWGLGGGPGHRAWAYDSAINGVGFSADGRLGFTATGNGGVEAWDLATGQAVHAARHPGGGVFAAVPCPDGRHVLTAGVNVALIDLAGRDPPRRLPGHRGIAWAAAVSPDGRTALTVGDDETARVWDLTTGAETRSLPHAGRLEIAAFSADGRLALTGGSARVRLWDAANWQELRPIGTATVDPADGRTAAAFSPDGRRIAMGTFGGQVKLFDAANELEVRTFAGRHTQLVGALAFAPDGRWLVSAGDDNTVRLWDVESGQELRALTGHDARLRTVAFSPDGRSIMSGDLAGGMRLWTLWSPEVAATKRNALDAATAAALNAPQDATAAAARLAALGDWYAWRGLPDWAATALEDARAGGADVSPLLLGRCYWQTGRTADARRELALALARNEAPEPYLRTCLARLEQPPTPATTRRATTTPTTAPAR